MVLVVIWSIRTLYVCIRHTYMYTNTLRYSLHGDIVYKGHDDHVSDVSFWLRGEPVLNMV